MPGCRGNKAERLEKVSSLAVHETESQRINSNSLGKEQQQELWPLKSFRMISL